MKIREASIEDIKQLKEIRHAVKENVLSNPALVTDADYHMFLVKKGKGWVAEVESHIVGFAIIDLEGKNIWALFLHPLHEKAGVGRKLHQTMMEWYFGQTTETVWLSTEANTRASKFYEKAGWIATGPYGHCEIKFEMTYQNWKQKNTTNSI